MSDAISTIKSAIDSLVSVYVRLERLEYELDRAEKHRDRLVEALRSLSQPLGRHDYTVAQLDDVVRKIALEALAAVKGGSDE